MNEILKELINKKVDINCGADALFSGEVLDVKESLVVIKDKDDRRVNISISKIVAITESSEPLSRPGFIGK